jgi:hypothetical protein
MATKPRATVVVAAYDPDVSMLHPLNNEDLAEIGNYVENEWMTKHGFYESAMALYNLCVRIGKAQAENPQDMGPKERAARQEQTLRSQKP